MSTGADPRSSEAGYMYAAITLLIWAGFVIVSRIGGTSALTVFDIAALRIGTAAIALSPWWVPRLLRPATRKLRWYQSLLFALLAGIAYPLIAFTGMTLAPASHGAVLISGVLPLFTSALAVLLLGERLSATRVAGLALILGGILTLLLGSGDVGARGIGTLRGDVLLLAAALIWSTFTVLLKVWQVRAFDVTLGVVAVSALIYLPVYVFVLPKNLGEASMAQIGLQAIFQGVFVVCLALWSYTKAAELIGPVRLVIPLSGVPVVGALLSVGLLGETLGGPAALGAAFVFLGALIGAVAKSTAR